MKIRSPAVSGLFYPAEKSELSGLIQEYMAEANTLEELNAKALIAPHAGYIYSGAIAASAYVHMLGMREKIKRIVLIGPSHRVPFRGIASPESECFSTPLGAVSLDCENIKILNQHSSVMPYEMAHATEHSLEVHLPFLQTILSEFSLIPLVVGDVDTVSMKEVLSSLFELEDTFTIISSDLSHYLTYPEAQIKDKNTSERILALDADIHGDEACGCRPINGLLAFCEQNDLRVRNVDLRNSGDTAGDKKRVVGYGAYVIH